MLILERILFNLAAALWLFCAIPVWGLAAVVAWLSDGIRSSAAALMRWEQRICWRTR